MAIDVLGLSGRVTSSPPIRSTRTTRCGSKTRSAKCRASSCPTAARSTTAAIIIEFLQDVAGTDRLLPLRGPARFKALTLARLADGIMDASILVVYENRFRPDAPPSQRWLEHQRGKIMRGLAAFEASPPDPEKTDVVSIGLSCALGYLDWRKQVDWRAGLSGSRRLARPVFRARAGIRAHARQGLHDAARRRYTCRSAVLDGRAQQAEAEAAARGLRRARARVRARARAFPSPKAAATRRPMPPRRCCSRCMRVSASSIA